MDKKMPIITPTSAKTPFSYGNLPKDLHAYMGGVDLGFINNYQHFVEEMAHRNPAFKFAQVFKDYQVHHFASLGILAHDGFYNSRLRDGVHKHLSPNLTEVREIGIFGNLGQFVEFGRTLQSVLETYTGSETDDTIGTTQLLACIVSSSGTVGAKVNQVAIKRGTAGSGGNYRGGVYDESGGLPSNLLCQTASTAYGATGAYTFVNTTADGTIATTGVWIAFANDATSSKVARVLSGVPSGHLRGNLSFTYGALDNPWTGTYNETADNFVYKCQGV